MSIETSSERFLYLGIQIHCNFRSIQRYFFQAFQLNVATIPSLIGHSILILVIKPFSVAKFADRILLLAATYIRELVRLILFVNLHIEV